MVVNLEQVADPGLVERCHEFVDAMVGITLNAFEASVPGREEYLD